MAIRYGNKYLKTSHLIDSIKLSEYATLTDTQKEVVRMIVSAGEVNFESGSKSWIAFHTYFPDGTDTWNAILEVVKQEYSEPPGE
jgi:hypothetical protein